MHRILTHSWNTGRLYTARGQVMAATLLDDGTVLFADLSRMIDGHIAKPRQAILTRADLQQFVDDRYLHNSYIIDAASNAFYQDAYRADRA